jgi:hypothetical protein
MNKVLNKVMLLMLLPAAGIAQMDLPASGGNVRARVSEEVGITDITVKYSRPDVNGREGNIWGGLVTYGFSTTNLNTNQNNMPWRAGANENTTITFEHDVKVAGKSIKAGTYGLHMAVWPDSVIIIFSNQTDSWGSFYYDDKQDALRVTVKPVSLDKSVEYLKYEFIEQKEKYCVIALQWEKLSIPFRVDVDVENIIVARLREQVLSQKGFNQLNLVAAANYCLNKNINLAEALTWSQRAAGLKSFNTLSTLGTAYTKNSKLPQADSVMNEALVFANANQHTGYGRSLIAAKRLDRAMEIFTANQKKHGDVPAVHTGFMYYYAAKGDFKNALQYADKVMSLSTSDAAKKALEPLMQKLKEGKDIN